MSRRERVLGCLVVTLGSWFATEVQTVPQMEIAQQPGYWVTPERHPQLTEPPPINKEEIDAQADALAVIPSVRVKFGPNRVPTAIEGLIGVLRSSATQKELDALMSALRPIFLGTGTESLRHGEVIDYPERDTRYIALRQFIRGLPVREAALTLETEASTGQIRAIRGRFLPDRGLAAEPKIKREDVGSRLAAEIQSAGYTIASFTILEGPELMYTMNVNQSGWLVWQAAISYEVGNGSLVSQWAYLDARDGQIVRTEPVFVSGSAPSAAGRSLG